MRKKTSDTYVKNDCANVIKVEEDNIEFDTEEVNTKRAER